MKSILFQLNGIRASRRIFLNVDLDEKEAILKVGFKEWSGSESISELVFPKKSTPKIWNALKELQDAIQSEGNFDGSFEDVPGY